MRWTFAVFAALVAAAPLHAQAAPTPYAITACSDSTAAGYPITHYRNDIPFSVEQAAELAIHEGVHRRQLTPDSTGTCQQKLDHILSSPAIALSYEAPAYCAQIRFVAETSNADFMGLRVRAAQLYSAGMGVPVAEVARVFREACPAPEEMPLAGTPFRGPE